MSDDYPLVTGYGDYADIEANVIDILKRGFRSDSRLEAIFSDLKFVDCNPQLITIEHVPAIHVWCDGSEQSSKTMGASLGRKQSLKEDYYCTVQMIHSSADEKDSARLVKHAGSVAKDYLYENLNLNGMMNHDGEVIETNFLPRPFDVGGQLKLMQGFKVTLKYTKIKRKKRATHRR